MFVFGPAGSRNIPTDRNPTTISVAGGASVTAGATTTLATYTVPAGRRAELAGTISGVVTTALAAAQAAEVQIAVTPNGGVFARPCSIRFNGNAAGVRGDSGIAKLYVKAGDLVEARATIGGGAGVLDTTGGFEGVEYDV